ncbi:MAG: 30S ribosomal protein S8 [Planctomycetes bacterium GWC2_49_10]|nr:MAG: 30S ribosomal protein S8 [Planctomycetes bacterium GWC2_49_10]
MSLNDPVADMLTRVRNAVRVGKPQVDVKASKVCEGIAIVLKQEGFIEGYDKIEDATKQGILRVSLKYSPDGESVIHAIDRTSKPGRRVYAGSKELPLVLGGMGIVVVSTSKGVFSDKVCRSENIGGEIICTVN